MGGCPALWVYHQYIIICSVLCVHTISTVEGYHQYCGGLPSVLWRAIISTAGGYHQYCEGLPSVLCMATISTVEDVQYGGDTMSTLGDTISSVDITY